MKKIFSTLMAGACLLSCALSFTACGGNNNPNGDPAHTHHWSSTYTEDGDRHYQSCNGCNEKKYSDHDYSTNDVCICGKHKPGPQIPATGISLNKESLTLAIGDSETLTATLTPENATDTVKWSAEPAGVVTMENGKVTAIAEGTATITATAGGKSANCSVSVNKPVVKELKFVAIKENDNIIAYTISGIGNVTDSEIVIPSEHKGKPVTSIDYGAFDRLKNLTSVTIPDSVTRIGGLAFRGCSNLTSITIPDSVTSIGENPFAGCDKLTYAEYDNGRYLGNQNNPHLVLVTAKSTDITICSVHTNAKIIADSAFKNCNNLTSIIISDSVTSIGNNAFSGCSSLTSVTIGNSVTSIGYSAFSGCSSLTSITIPDSITSISEDAFNGCSSLTSITIPDSVTSIGYSAFRGCHSLTSITIPDSVTTIGKDAFENCSSLTSITIPDSVTSIGEDAFNGCNKLTYTEYDNGRYLGNPNNPHLVLVKAGSTEITTCNIHADTKLLYLSAFMGCSDLISITIPDSVTSIGEDAFNGCSSLTSITIPDSVTSIGYSAFRGCSNLTSITIPDSVTSIDNSAFRDCHSLTSVTIPDSVTTIGTYTFHGCRSLTSVTIPDSVTTIDKDAFGGSIKSVYFEGDIADWCSISGLENLMGLSTTLYINNQKLTGELIIPNNVTSISDYAFYNCSSLTSVTIPDSVTNIGSSAFRGCSSLTSVTIPDSVTSIGSSAFDSCTSLTSIIIPDSVTSIGDYAFEDCSSLTSITIPDSVISIGKNAFKRCNIQPTEYDNGYYLGNENNPHLVLVNAKSKKITSCTIHADTKIIANGAFEQCKSLTSITIPDSVTTIGKDAFYYCESLTSVTIGNGVTSIGKQAFSFCSSLTNVTISDSVTSIGDYAFSSSSSLTSVTIPDSVTSIGDFAFYSCNSLTSITYDGSKEQWHAIEKNSSWKRDTGNFTVHCTDGDLSMEEA